MIDVSQVHNRGRVICISSFREDGYVRSLESFFQETIVQINQRNFPPTHMPIHHCDFVVVNIYPNPPTLTLKGKNLRNFYFLLNLTLFVQFRAPASRIISPFKLRAYFSVCKPMACKSPCEV